MLNKRTIALIVILLAPHPGCALFPLIENESADDGSVVEDPIEIQTESGGVSRSPAQATYPMGSTWSSQQSSSSRSNRFFPANPDPQIQRGLESETLVLGMRMDDVVAVWGKPQQIEAAGDTRQGNQKWSYINSVLNQWNPRPVRTIYFEQGRVIGWENANKR